MTDREIEILNAFRDTLRGLREIEVERMQLSLYQLEYFCDALAEYNAALDGLVAQLRQPLVGKQPDDEQRRAR